MKDECKSQLIKDLIMAFIAWVIGFALIAPMYLKYGFMGVVMCMCSGFMIAGIPFGWRWLSNVFIAVSIFTIALKGVAALFLGWIALPVVLIKDIIAYKKAE